VKVCYYFPNMFWLIIIIIIIIIIIAILKENLHTKKPDYCR